MKVAVLCEYSGIVREAFALRGHYAVSCDLLPTELPVSKNARHIQGDCQQYNWSWADLIIAHPPCTYISNMSNCRIHEPGRLEKRKEAMKFFLWFTQIPCSRIAIENPKGLPEREYRKADQIIQPYQFGYPASKATCLWLTNLPLLKPTNIVTPERKWDGKRYRTWVDTFGSHNSKARSKTFPGIAAAFADQWGVL